MPELQLVHPMIVHFPIVLILVALVYDLWSTSRGTPLTVPSAAIAIAAGGFAIIAAMLGDAAAEFAMDHGVAENVIETHEGLGMATAVLLGVVALWRLFALWRGISLVEAKRSLTLVAEAAAVVLVLITAGFGGNLVYDHGVNVAGIAPVADAASGTETD